MPIQDTSNKNKKIDFELLFAQTIGIFAVIDGHYKSLYPTLYKFFGYYPWHMPFFISLSGILFARSAGKRSPSDYFLRKCKTLLIPALFINFCYGLIYIVMRHYGFVISLGTKLDINSLLLSPFGENYQFRNNISLWFVFQLFVIELIANIIYRIPQKNLKDLDFIILITSFLISLFCTAFSRTNAGSVEKNLLLLRTGFLFFFFAFGVWYEKYVKEFLKKRDKYETGCFIALTVQTVIVLKTHWDFHFNTRTMNMERLNNSYQPYISFLTAFAFIMCLAGFLSPVLQNSRFLHFIGPNIRYIVYHHQFFGILIGSVALLIHASGRGNLLPRFNPADFIQKQWYAFGLNGGGLGKILYIVIPFFGPILTAKLINKNTNQFIRFAGWCAALALVLIFYAFFGMHFREYLAGI